MLNLMILFRVCRITLALMGALGSFPAKADPVDFKGHADRGTQESIHADAHPIHALVDQYGTEFMQALRRRSTVRKQVDVLHHIAGYFKHRLDKDGKRELRQVIEEYHRGLVPLIAPLTLINHYVRLFEVEYLQQQIYLNPHPKELMLRNHGVTFSAAPKANINYTYVNDATIEVLVPDAVKAGMSFVIIVAGGGSAQSKPVLIQAK